MKMISALALVLLLAAQAPGDNVPKADAVVLQQPSPDIVNPRVSCQADISGTAYLAPSHHLWIMVVRADFGEVYYPQAEATVDPSTHAWKVHAQFGERRDIGSEFVIAAVVVDQSQHLVLTDYRVRAMTTGDWRPIRMPPTVTAPLFKTVIKSGHNCD